MNREVEGPKSCLPGVPIFRSLPPAGAAELTMAMHHHRYERGQVVLGAGDPVEHLIVLARGRLKLSHMAGSGREQVVRILEPGDFLGEMALFAPAVCEGDLVALEPSEACLLPREAVQDLLRRHPEVALPLLQAIAARLAETEQLAADLGLRDVGQRLAAELAREAGAGEPVPGGVMVRVPMPWSQMAARLGTTPESLSRRLKSLADQGLLTQQGPRLLVIHDIEQLKRLADT